MYFTYLLKCRDGSLYAGSTNDLARRVKQHNESKKGARYTKARRPVTLAYHEVFKTFREARVREAELKSWRREKKLALCRSSAPRKTKKVTRENKLNTP